MSLSGAALLAFQQLPWRDVEHVAESFQQIGGEKLDAAPLSDDAVEGAHVDAVARRLGDGVGRHPALVHHLGESQSHQHNRNKYRHPCQSCQEPHYSPLPTLAPLTILLASTNWSPG